ncbi:Helix-turn-helix domain of resolvase [Mycobacteroides abscessus subsp. abscessus]|nr:Helix-turn-helix domain of resolvase [Mycobacteroides abscessus subsp. abscessus]SHV12727.1 Helix-turn-helix domain of resolvase [Mycobacteroides abscessus subsp. abscessus]
MGLGRLIERVESAPKRRSSSGNGVPGVQSLYRRLSPEMVEELVAAYRAGESANSLCRRFGVSKGGVLKLLADHQVPMRYQPMTVDEIDQAVQLYATDGFPIRIIAKKLGKSKDSVRKALRARGVVMRPAH